MRIAHNQQVNDVAKYSTANNNLKFLVSTYMNALTPNTAKPWFKIQVILRPFKLYGRESCTKAARMKWAAGLEVWDR